MEPSGGPAAEVPAIESRSGGAGGRLRPSDLDCLNRSRWAGATRNRIPSPRCRAAGVPRLKAEHLSVVRRSWAGEIRWVYRTQQTPDRPPSRRERRKPSAGGGRGQMQGHHNAVRHDRLGRTGSVEEDLQGGSGHVVPESGSDEPRGDAVGFGFGAAAGDAHILGLWIDQPANTDDRAGALSSNGLCAGNGARSAWKGTEAVFANAPTFRTNRWSG